MRSIQIQHMDCVAWIALSNSYTWDQKPGTWDPNVDQWQGVLFQFGDYTSMVGAKLNAFDGVKLFKGSTTVVHLPRAKFETGNYAWINVVARRADSGRVDPPMNETQLGKLLINPATNKPIRNYFTPLPGGMTFWHDKGGYTMKAKQDVHFNQHDSFMFKFANRPGGYVSVSENGAAPTLYRLGADVTRVVVLATASAMSTHGQQANPPQFP